jgi:FAD/FMN-containing dehydrogenase
MNPAPTTADWDALRSAIAGEVVLPESPGYESVRKPVFARFHSVWSQAIVLCENPEDVSEAIAFARRSGLHPVPRSGGHCFAGRSSTDGIVIDVSPMHSVSVSGGVATVGAGARLGEVYDALGGFGLTIPAGCGPMVGISGLTLGGGRDILGRKHGLTSDSLLATQVVLADGSIVECNDYHHKDLFWALRGAGGCNLGVVTSLTFETLPAPEATSFRLIWPHSDTAAVIDAWQRWAPYGPEELAASLLVTASGDTSKLPVVNMFGAMLGAESDTAQLIDELVVRAGAGQASTSYNHTSYQKTKQYLSDLGDTMADDRRQGYPYSKSEFFRRPLPTEAIVSLVENLAKRRVAGQSRQLDLTPWGGAYNRVSANATAFVHRDERFLLKHAVEMDPATSASEREAARCWLGRSWATVRPWGSAGVYPNFPDPDLTDWAHAYHRSNYGRLVRVKRRYDPDDFFRFHQALSGQPPESVAPETGSSTT